MPTLTNRPVSEWSVPPGTSSAPSTKFQYRLCAPLRWWRFSIAQQWQEKFATSHFASSRIYTNRFFVGGFRYKCRA
jgi:hypothetical protein